MVAAMDGSLVRSSSIPCVRLRWPAVCWSRQTSLTSLCSLCMVTWVWELLLAVLYMSACISGSRPLTINIPRQRWELHFHARQPISHCCLHSQGGIIDQLPKGRRAVGLPARSPFPGTLLLWCLWLRGAGHCLGLLWRGCLCCPAPASPVMPTALPKGYLFAG